MRVAVFALVLGVMPAASAQYPDDAPDAVTGLSEPDEDESDDGDGIFFPVQLPVNYSDTWGAPRGGGRTHEGVDILGDQMQEAYAAVDGEIMRAYGEDCVDGQRCSSYALAIAGDDGRGYFYVHMNNDTPGRPDGCDNIGGVENAFSPRLVEELEQRGTLVGVRVRVAEHIGYVGSSGNSGCGVDHIHFEIWNDHDYGRSGGKVNPYPTVRAAQDADRTFTEPQAEQVAAAARIAGAERFATSAALSEGAFDSAPAVVIARGDVYTDALIAAPLAAALDSPVLLVPDEGLATSGVIEEINRLAAESLVVVGNVSGSVIASVVQGTSIEAQAVSVLKEDDVYALSASVARAVVQAGESPDRVLVAAGSAPDGRSAWPDALMASLLGSYNGEPVVLTDPASLSAATAEVLSELGVRRATIVGGTAAISTAVADQIKGTGATVDRLAGGSRLDTAVAVADEIESSVEGIDLSTFYIATANNFPDALAAGPSLSRNGSIMLLMGTPAGSSPVTTWVGDRADGIDQVLAIGGTAALSDRSADAVSRAAD